MQKFYQILLNYDYFWITFMKSNVVGLEWITISIIEISSVSLFFD